MRPPTALTIAGSDSGGGAGIQADLKTFLDHRVYGMSVLTALTAQNTLGVQAIFDVSPEFLREQLQSIRADLPVDAIKIGMVADAARATVIADFLEAWPDRPPVVLDPVMIAKGGAPLLRPDAVAVLRERLAPLATLVTPNIPEAEVLGDLPGITLLRKGGHADGPVVEDVLEWQGQLHRFRNERIVSKNTHGTGCTLAAAITAQLARGHSLPEACALGVAYVARLLKASGESVGHGHGPLLHGLLPT
jgi:hydroxymethylpyrimidine/phosphomethylpyrimidine kinase